MWEGHLLSDYTFIKTCIAVLWAWFETATRSSYACLDASSPQSGLVFVNVKKETVRGEECIDNEVRVSVWNHDHATLTTSSCPKTISHRQETNLNVVNVLRRPRLQMYFRILLIIRAVCWLNSPVFRPLHGRECRQ